MAMPQERAAQLPVSTGRTLAGNQRLYVVHDISSPFLDILLSLRPAVTPDGLILSPCNTHNTQCK